MKEIEITLERLKELLYYNPNTGQFIRIKKSTPKSNNCKIGDIVGIKGARGYVYIKVDGYRYMAHRLAYFYYHGYIDNTLQIDHINHDRSDNRIDNLRLCSQSENMRNKPLSKRNKSGQVGICKHKKNKGLKGYVWLLQWKENKRTRQRYFPFNDEGFKQAIEVRNEAYKLNGYTDNHGK